MVQTKGQIIENSNLLFRLHHQRFYPKELAEGTKFVVTSSSYDDLEFSYSLYSYVYAGLTWGEYWSQESVTAAGNVSGSDEKDSHNESDTGAFDAVTRATTNHGLHRGSYQCMATIYTTEGNAYQLSYWKSSTARLQM